MGKGRRNKEATRLEVEIPKGIKYLWFLVGAGLYIAGTRVRAAGCKIIASVCTVKVK